jgi:hypothetical protein
VKIEDHTNVKASKNKDDHLKFKEVQEAMTNTLEKNKDEWANAAFFEKLAKSPRLMQAFTNPEYSQVMKEVGENPQQAMQKYGHNPAFKELMMEFSAFMGNHFTDVAD